MLVYNQQTLCDYCKKLTKPLITITSEDEKIPVIITIQRNTKISQMITSQRQAQFNFCNTDCFCQWVLDQLSKEEEKEVNQEDLPNQEERRRKFLQEIIYNFKAWLDCLG